MESKVIAAQLYTLRDYLKTPEDIEKTLRKVKDIGYDAVQVSAMGPIDPARLKEIVDELELNICCTHMGYDRFINDIDTIIDIHKLWDCKYVGLGSIPNEYRTGREGILRAVNELSDKLKKLKDNGLQFIYHNHSFEFEKFDGETMMDILFNQTDPEAFHFEIDTYWVQAGGADPVEWIKKVKGRMDVIHLKDMAIKKNEQIFAEIGEGNLNWTSILNACKDIGVKWYCIEQDKCQRDPFESLAISLKYLENIQL